MTTITEFGEMLIEVGENGREIQRRWLRPRDDNNWEEFIGPGHKHINEIDLGDYIYRLKPKTSYYRVFIGTNHELGVRNNHQPFPPFDEWIGHDRPTSAHLIRDFEVEEE